MKAYILPQLLLESCRRFPDKDAVRCSGEALSYEQLEERSSRLACTLIDEGVRPGDRVGLYLDKSLASVVAVYGAMKARAAYVPIDPLVPSGRLAFVVRDCGIRHLVTAPEKWGRLRKVLTENTRLETLVGVEPQEGAEPRCIPWSEVWRAPAHVALGRSATELDLAYVLYTSGSTGRPKGVMHTHRSALAFVEWAVEEVGVAPGDRLGNHAPFHFDLSVFDLFAAAAAGATTVIVPEDVARFPASLAGLIEDEAVTVWYSVPFALIQMLHRGDLGSRDLGALRTVLYAGEPFPPRLLHDLMARLPDAAIYNLYGPTETNVCTFHRVAPLADGAEEPIPIGRPCANTEVLVVDGEGEEVPAGEPGELWVRGASTMAGYWGRPELTADALAHRPAEPPLERTFYRTGDMVRADDDGILHFLGRRDRQVKVRGFRIELDEIEGALLLHDQVAEAAVYLVSNDGEDAASIEAAVVATPGSTLSTESLVRHLSGLLPPYAVPARITAAEVFPRTSTGKLDRRRLMAGPVTVGDGRERWS